MILFSVLKLVTIYKIRLDILHEYCHRIFKFTYNNDQKENVNFYTYLGVKMSSGGSFSHACETLSGSEGSISNEKILGNTNIARI